MTTNTISIRLMTADDFDAVVRIDEKILKTSRPEYYELKFEKLFESREYLPTSFVAQNQDGTVVGFIMGELFMGQYGISHEGATVDTIGVDPDVRDKGIGKRLMAEFIDHLKDLDVKKINTLVEKNNSQLMHFFNSNQFRPSQTIVNLERSI